MPTLLTPPTLERVIRGLHESKIRCRIQNEPPAGGIYAPAMPVGPSQVGRCNGQ
jgi:hypothetical protein